MFHVSVAAKIAEDMLTVAKLSAPNRIKLPLPEDLVSTSMPEPEEKKPKQKDFDFTFIMHGDAVPYTRMTQGQVKLMRIPDGKLRPEGLKVKEKIRRYLNWKESVLYVALTLKFPRDPKEKIFLNVMCWFKNKAHADPENIRKGIQDALFEQDKLVAGAVDFDYDPQNPRTEITISSRLTVHEQNNG